MQSQSIDNTRELARTFGEPLSAWGSRAGLPDTGYARAQAGLALLNTCLERLGDRDANLRAQLTLQRDTAARAIEAVASIMGDTDRLEGFSSESDVVQPSHAPKGALFAELANRFDAAITDLNAAKHAFASRATKETARSFRDAQDAAEAELADTQRQIFAAVEAITYPELLDPKLVEAAKTSTEALARMPARKPTARQMHRALDEGAAAKPAEVRLWPIFATDPTHALIELRLRRFAEDRG